MLRRIDPFDRMTDMFRDFDALFREAMEEFRGLASEMPGRHLLPAGSTLPAPAPARRHGLLAGWSGFRPAVECFTRDKDVVVRAELPGVDPADVEVSVADGRLVIRGQKREQRASDAGTFHYGEVAHGEFERTFVLPDGTKTDQVKASYGNGVLEVIIPTEGLPVTRKVPVEIGEGSAKKAIKAA